VGFFELKLAKGTSIAFDSVREHQIEALCQASGDDGIYHKISDSPVSWQQNMRFTKPKPFDCFFLKNQPAYVVICWYVPRLSKDFHYIPIANFIQAKNTATRKSLTKQMSAEITQMTMSA